MQINQYPNEAVSLVGTDLFDIDKDMGAGVWLSHKLKFSTLITEIGANSTFGKNIGNTNLTLTNNRTLNLDNKKFVWLKVKQFNATAGTTPNAGEGSYNFRGYGTTSGDILMRVGNGASIFTRWFGNGELRHEASIDGGYGATFYNFGVNGSAAYYSGTTYGIQTQGGVYGMTSHGVIGGLFSGTSIGVRATTDTGGTAIRAEQGSGVCALNTDGRVQLSNLPTSATGLSIGELWNDSGTIKIV